MTDGQLDFASLRSARHQAALQVLRESDAERTPLVVYLRKFDIHAMHGPSELERQFGEDMVLEALPEEARIITIQEEPMGETIRAASSRVPALWLGGAENWKSVLMPILARAELIISEFTFMSEGVRWELEACRSLGKHHQTVLVLPPTRSEFACLDHLAPIDQFPRTMWADQLFTEQILENFVIRDLIKRITQIGRLTVDQRKAMYADGTILKEIPISYEGVLEGYIDRTRDWQIEATFPDTGSTQHIDYYRFWDWFRVASVLGVLVREIKSRSMKEAASDFASAYIEVLQGISHNVVELDQDGSFLTSEMANNIAGSIHPFIKMLPKGPGSGMLTRYADRTLERFGQGIA